jgi:TPR repeat protein
MSGEKVQADFEACDELLCNGESREEFIEVNIERMEAWKESADLGDACGQLLYGLCFFYGHGEDEDEDAAIEWFTKSAQQGNAHAQCSLGLCYENGWGCRENQNLANDWFKKAATQGHQKAIDELPLSLKVQLGIEPHKVLTKEIAEQFLADEDSVDLSEFTAIEDEAAEVLATLEACALNLSGLTSLGEAAAAFLSKCDEDTTLNLDGLSELSDQAIEYLADFQGYALLLSGVLSISDDGIEKLSSVSAELSLSGLAELSDKAASVLANHDGQLHLNGLQTLSNEAAMSLASHEADISLASFQAFPSNSTAAEELAKNIGSQSFIDLGGLLELDSSVAKTLADAKANLPFSETQFDEILLSELHELSPEAATHLARRCGTLNLMSITNLSDEVAEQLSNHRGHLVLEGLESLTEEAASKLVSHRGDLRIELSALPESVVEILQTHPSLFPIHEEDDDEDETAFSDSGSGDVSFHRAYFVDIEQLVAATIIPAEFGSWLADSLIGNSYYDFCEELFDVEGLSEQWAEHVPNYPCPDSYIAPKRDYYLYVSGAELECGRYYFGWSEKPRRADYNMETTTEMSSFSWRCI